MTKCIQYCAALLLLSSTGLSWAAQTVMPIYQVSDVQGTFIQVPLTHDIYRYSQQANLQNLVVLDAENNPLPSRLVDVIPSSSIAKAKISTKELGGFPVAADASPDTLRKLHDTQVNMQGDKVQIATSDKILNNKTPEFYLVDISKIDMDITSLILEWDSRGGNQYLEVELEATRNLQDWFILTRATLVQINQPGQSLKHNHIKVNIPKKNYEFLRLKILRGAENLHITRFAAEHKLDVITKATASNEKWSVIGELSKIQSSVYFASSHSKTFPVAAWEFTRNEAAPIETIALDFGANIYGDSATIFSRATANQNWQLQFQGVWFNAQVGAQWQKSDAVSVHRNSDKYWRVELNESVKNNPSPNLIFNWQPMQLQIIVNNKPPFRLAINNDKSNSYNREQVFNQIISTASPTWVAASLIKLDVQPDAVIAVHQRVEWQQWIFWAALVLAVLVLLLFSLKLFKQLKLIDAQQ